MKRNPLVIARRSVFTPVAALALCAALVGCSSMSGSSSGPAPEEITEETSATATVVAVDAATREITLRDTTGTWSVQAGPEVRNFAEIAPGDSVTVRYRESLAVALAPPGVGVAAPTATVVAGTAAPGQRPAAAIGSQITMTVRIESVDTQANIVVFTPASGGLRAIRVRTPEGQRFIRDLKRGDSVEITWAQAMAVAVTER
jgi:hypothetical protein